MGVFRGVYGLSPNPSNELLKNLNTKNLLAPILRPSPMEKPEIVNPIEFLFPGYAPDCGCK